jgi:hypothetical protein
MEVPTEPRASFRVLSLPEVLRKGRLVKAKTSLYEDMSAHSDPPIHELEGVAASSK